MWACGSSHCAIQCFVVFFSPFYCLGHHHLLANTITHHRYHVRVCDIRFNVILSLAVIFLFLRARCVCANKFDKTYNWIELNIMYECSKIWRKMYAQTRMRCVDMWMTFKDCDKMCYRYSEIFCYQNKWKVKLR